MHKEILSDKQIEFLPAIKNFNDEFGLIGGTAIALHLGHRRSIDFDLMTDKALNNGAILTKVKSLFSIEKVLIDKENELTFVADGVKMTFLHYPFKIDFSESFEDIIKTPDLLTLASMKSYALGRRAKWKDYVDLCFIMKNGLSVNEISKRSHDIFGNEFNDKSFRAQLAYFADIDYTEEVEFVPGFELEQEEIKKHLIDFSLL